MASKIYRIGPDGSETLIATVPPDQPVDMGQPGIASCPNAIAGRRSAIARVREEWPAVIVGYTDHFGGLYNDRGESPLPKEDGEIADYIAADPFEFLLDCGYLFSFHTNPAFTGAPTSEDAFQDTSRSCPLTVVAVRQPLPELNANELARLIALQEIHTEAEELGGMRE